MMNHRACQLAIAFACVSVIACAKVQSPNPPGNSSETHFLRRCSADACAGGLSCVCGVCSKSCENNSSCGGLPQGTACTKGGYETCAVETRCDFTCAHDSDCTSLGKDYACSAGRCRAPELASMSSNSAPNDAARAACDHYFAAQYMTPCATPTRPDAELARMKARFASACLSQIAAPGSGMTPSAIEACASALEAIACQWQYPPAACNFYGSLPGGTPCNESMQCQSGACSDTHSLSGPGGPTNMPTRCGTCAPGLSEGQDCSDESNCVAGFECITTMTSAPNPVYTCTKVSEGDVGASCDELTAECKPGSYCIAGRCAALHTNAGDPCGATQGPGGCRAPLSCSSDHVCVAPGAEGDDCSGSRLCAAGLACGAIGPQRCLPMTWVEPGSHCDASSYCRIGDCPSHGGPLGADVCPMISADGESCMGDFNCDAFSDCIDGVCAIRDSMVCR